MSNVKIGFVALCLLVSPFVLLANDHAGKLSQDHGLNSEEAIVVGFSELREHIKQILGPSVWLSTQVEVIEAVASGEFLHFDPLVRETSCELRALFGVYIFRRLGSVVELEGGDADLATLIYILSHAIRTNYGEDGFGAGDSNRRTPLGAFLSEVGGSYSKTKLDQLIKALERAVAYGSVMFARRLAAEIDAEIDSDVCRALLALFTRQCIFDDIERKRPVVSCLGICQLELEYARLRQVPVVVRTRLSATSTGTNSSGTVVAIYLYDGERFALVDHGTIAPNTPVLAVDAVTTRFGSGDAAAPPPGDVERYLQELDFEEVWLSGAAAHPQFAGANAEAELVDTPGCDVVVREFPRLEQEAERIGTSHTNRSGQFVDHTYVTTYRLATQYAGRLGGQERAPIILGNSGLYYPAQHPAAAVRLALWLPARRPAAKGSASVVRPALHLPIPSPVCELGELATPGDIPAALSPFFPVRPPSRGLAGGSQRPGSRTE